MGFSSAHSTRWLFLSTVSKWNWNLECWFLWMEEKQRTRRKTHGANMRTNKEHNAHLTPQWWEASPLTTVPSLSPAPLEIEKSIDLFKCSVSFVLKDVMCLILMLLHKIHLCKLKGFIHAGTVNHSVLWSWSKVWGAGRFFNWIS